MNLNLNLKDSEMCNDAVIEELEEDLEMCSD